MGARPTNAQIPERIYGRILRRHLHGLLGSDLLVYVCLAAVLRSSFFDASVSRFAERPELLDPVCLEDGLTGEECSNEPWVGRECVVIL